MLKKLPFLNNTLFTGVVFFLLFFLIPSKSYSQCAGNDATITICDYANPANSAVNLFTLLGGTPTPGGTWSDDLLSGGLNPLTGILNVHQIRESDTYTYTYTVTGVPGCTDNTSTVTVIIGGYTGVPGPDGVVCGSEGSYNLFQLFSGVGGSLPPQFGGDWFNVTLGVPVVGNTISPSGFNVTVPTTYQFSYTIPAISTCPSSTANAFLTVYPPAEPGTPTDLQLCSDDDLSLYTNVDLFSLLVGEDSGGSWTENSGTNELTSITDSFINVQNIYNTFGAGTYSFTYRVFPSSPICEPQTATVNVIIEDRINFTGSSLVVNSDVCENQLATATFTGVITQGSTPIPNGAYIVTYTVTPSGGSFTANANFASGVLNFIIPNGNFPAVGTYTVTVTNIVPASAVFCPPIQATFSDTLTINPAPNATGSVLSVEDVCQNVSANAILSNATGLTDGSYTFTYQVSGANNSAVQSVVVNVVGGVANFVIPGTLLTNAGNTVAIITSITNNTTGCSSIVNIADIFEVKPLPVITSVVLNVSDICINSDATAVLSGLGSMTSITITYDLSGVNTSTGNSVVIPVVSGSGSFAIPASLLTNTGTTTINITSLANNSNSCGVAVSTVSDSFIINPLPTAPTASNQEFCLLDNPTVADLNPQGSQYVWYNVISGGTALATTDPLVSGNYYLEEVNLTTGCSSPRTMITVTINSVTAPTSATLIVNDVCQISDTNAVVNNAISLPDGSYTISYELTGANSSGVQTVVVNVVGGVFSYTIPGTLLTNAGNTTCTISSIMNNVTLCSVPVNIIDDFVVNPLPVVPSLVLTVNDTCLNEPVNVTLSGLGTLTNVDITYNLSGANTSVANVLSITAVSGTATFTIPASQVPNIGTTTFTLTGITNLSNSCGIVNINVSDDFVINDLPVAPSATNQEFCLLDNATVANLLPIGTQYAWYNVASGGTALASSTVLVTGDYYLEEINTTGCRSARTMITVTIHSVVDPTLNPQGNEFCALDNPTLADLAANTSGGSSMIWYDALTGGNILASSTLLQNGVTYYGYNTNATGCNSQNAISVTVDLAHCDNPEEEYDFFIPDGFSPNGDGVNDTFRIPNIEFIFPDFTLEIYNRYGDLLFEGNKVNPDWNGKNSGKVSVGDKEVPNGVYFYIVNFNKNNKPAKQGRLYLNR